MDDAARRTALRVLAIGALLAGTAGVAGCSTGPASSADVCTAYDDLGRQLIKGNGVFGNPLFHKADHLGDLAKHYQGVDLTSDANALHHIAKADSTSGQEIMQATSGIADLCGHPLGLDDAFGGG